MNGEPLKFVNLTENDRVENGQILYVRSDITMETEFKRKGNSSYDSWKYHPETMRKFKFCKETMDFLLVNRGKPVTVNGSNNSGSNSMHVKEHSFQVLTTMFCRRNV